MHVSTSEYTWWYILFDIRCISQHTYIYPGMEENRIVNKPIVVWNYLSDRKTLRKKVLGQGNDYITEALPNPVKGS